jgi:hypothetical protein
MCPLGKKEILLAKTIQKPSMQQTDLITADIRKEVGRYL